MYKYFLIPIFFIFFGCGSSSESSPSLIIGTLEDSAVFGAKYQCVSSHGITSKNGTTDIDGTYSCFVDDNVTFYISGFKLPLLKARNKPLTPQDFYSSSVNQVRLAQIFQTLDVDKNPENGIELNESNISTLEINSTHFEEDLALLLSIGTSEIISFEAALTHLNITLKSLDTQTVNTNPLAYPSSFTLLENSTLLANLIAEDFDHDTLVFSVEKFAQHGGLFVSSDGNFTYKPDVDYVGEDSFLFSVSDGINQSSLVTITLIINNVNQAPTVNSESIEINENSRFEGQLRGEDVDGDLLSYQLDISVSHGTLSFSNLGEFIYKPNIEYVGVDSFSYHVSDGALFSFSATVNIDVLNVNKAPIANELTITVQENSSVVSILSGEDPDGDTVTFVLATQPNHGSLTFSSSTNDGTFTYTPTNGFFGTDSFTFHVNDGVLNSLDKKVNITVEEEVIVIVEPTPPVTVIEEPTITIPSGQRALLIVRVGFNDIALQESDDTTFATRIFSNTIGTVNHYFLKNSQNKFEYIPVQESSGISNDGIVTINISQNHPNIAGGNLFFVQPLLSTILTSINSTINFAQYDNDKSGSISYEELQIMFVFAGFETSYGGGNSPSIWAHQSSMNSADAPTLDGVRLMAGIDDGVYALFGERHDDHLATIGIIAHELSHSTFKLPDLYDTDGSSAGIGAFGLMGGGSWGQKSFFEQPGSTPVQMSAWSKIQMNWIDVDSVSSTTLGYTLADNDQEDYHILKLPTAISNEYFLVENRGTSGYDKGLQFLLSGGYQGGLLIWHIDDNINGFSVNDDENHKKVDVEEANDTLLDSSQSNYGHANAFFFESNSDSFTDTTFPNSKLYDETSSGITIENISSISSTMNLDIVR
jgi:M6 family metalloprotease-like protein